MEAEQGGTKLNNFYSGVAQRQTCLPAGRATGNLLMYHVYVIKSLKDNKHYTGITNDLVRRLREHNHGKRSTSSTRTRGPFVLVYSENVKNRELARKREIYFKSGVGREFLKNIIPA